MDGAGAPMPSWIALWNEWEIQVVVIASFSLQVILFFFAGIRRYSVSFVLKALLWLVYLLADVVATYALGHMSSSLSKKSSSEHQLVAFWAPFLLLHLGGQDTITAYALEDNELWLRHLLNMFVQVACTAYVLYKYIIAGGANFVHAAMLVLASGVLKYGERIWALKLASKGGSRYKRRRRPRTFRRWISDIRRMFLTKKHVDVLTDEPSYTVDWGAVDLVQAVKGVRATERMVVRAFARAGRWVDKIVEIEEGEKRDCFTKNKQFGTYAFIVMTAHVLRHVLVKPLIIDRNEASIDWNNHRIALQKKGHAQEYQWENDQSKDASAKERHIGEMYQKIEVQLAVMYDMLYTKAEVIHTRYGYCIRAISLASCFAALVVFTKSKRDGYSTPDIVITFALLGGACALEMASVFKAIGSTWTCASLRRRRWKWLANAILFARYHLVIVKDGRWSDSVGQFNFISFCVHSSKRDLKGRIARLIGLRDFWNKVRCTKHAKLSPAVKEFVCGILKGDKRHMVRIEDVSTRRGYWARKFSGIGQIKQLDWSMSSEFHESVLIWHIATGTFLNNPAVESQLVDKDKDMAKAVNTLSDYMMYLLIKHPAILQINPDARNLFDKACYCYFRFLRYSHRKYNVDEYHESILDCKEGASRGLRGPDKDEDDLFQNEKDYDEYVSQGEAVLVKAGIIARTMLGMKLGVKHRMILIGSVWTEMLRYAATSATEGFHARQLSNGGEFLTHILLLAKYSSLIDRKTKPPIEADETVEPSAAAHVQVNVDDDSDDEITEVRLT